MFILAYCIKQDYKHLLEGALQNRRHKQIAIDKLVKMAQYLLKISYLKFNNDVFQKMSGTAIGTNFAPP